VKKRLCNVRDMIIQYGTGAQIMTMVEKKRFLEVRKAMIERAIEILEVKKYRLEKHIEALRKELEFIEKKLKELESDSGFI